MLPLTEEELYQGGKLCYICGKRTLKKLPKSNCQKVRDHCHYTGKYRGTARSICNLKFNVLNEIAVVFHNSSNYDFHFIIKELANQYEEKFECLWQITEKYKTFSVPIEKEVAKKIKIAIKLLVPYLIKKFIKSC